MVDTLYIDFKFLNERAVKQLVSQSRCQDISSNAICAMNSLLNEILYNFAEVLIAASGHEPLCDASGEIIVLAIADILPREIANPGMVQGKQLVEEELADVQSGKKTWEQVVFDDLKNDTDLSSNGGVRKYLVPYGRTFEALHAHIDSILGTNEGDSRSEMNTLAYAPTVLLTGVLEYFIDDCLTVIAGFASRNTQRITGEDVLTALSRDAIFGRYFWTTATKKTLEVFR
jgi:hypothetical protein